MMRRLIWNAIAAAVLTCFMPPLLELTTFEHLWSFLPMLFLPLLLSHLSRRYFLLGSLGGLLLSFYLILTPGAAPWGIFTEISSDIQSVINGELPGRPAFALSIGLISFDRVSRASDIPESWVRLRACLRSHRVHRLL